MKKLGLKLAISVLLVLLLSSCWPRYRRGYCWDDDDHPRWGYYRGGYGRYPGPGPGYYYRENYNNSPGAEGYYQRRDADSSNNSEQEVLKQEK